MPRTVKVVKSKSKKNGMGRKFDAAKEIVDELIKEAPDKDRNILTIILNDADLKNLKNKKKIPFGLDSSGAKIIVVYSGR